MKNETNFMVNLGRTIFFIHFYNEGFSVYITICAYNNKHIGITYPDPCVDALRDNLN